MSPLVELENKKSRMVKTEESYPLGGVLLHLFNINTNDQPRTQGTFIYADDLDVNRAR